MKFAPYSLVLACFCTAAQGASFESIQASQKIDATRKTFLQGVSWDDSPTEAYYYCTNRADKFVSELWQGQVTQIRAPNSQQPLAMRFGRHGSIRVFDSPEGHRSVLLMLPSGETHAFRYSTELEIMKSSAVMQCKMMPAPEPTTIDQEQSN